MCSHRGAPGERGGDLGGGRSREAASFPAQRHLPLRLGRDVCCRRQTQARGGQGDGDLQHSARRTPQIPWVPWSQEPPPRSQEVTSFQFRAGGAAAPAPGGRAREAPGHWESRGGGTPGCRAPSPARDRRPGPRKSRSWED